jgi:2-polyprenyl-3-methyl-5-hydroxy-6-metoxy-1,4-benzoquinol methylase
VAPAASQITQTGIITPFKMISVSCNLCGRDDWRLRYEATMNAVQPEVDAFRCTSTAYGHHLQIVECRQCGHVYANPRWKSSELLTAYQAVEDETYLVEQAARRKTFTRRLQAIERTTGRADGRQLLDVGAYIGVFVEVAQDAGWDATGVEPSEWASETARNNGLPVIKGDLDSPSLQDRRFDVITMWDVIEHVDDPAAELAKSHRLLEPGGLIVVHTMNIDSLLARLMGRRWPWLMDMHIHYFSRTTLIKMLENAGFEVIRARAEGRYLSLRYLASRVEALNRALGRLLARLVRATNLSTRSLPVNLGDLMTVYARKPVDNLKKSTSS